MKHLVNVQGVTIVSVIHQPRKFIFDLFDSLILLGVGGRMVYHGPTSQAYDYFHRLDYVLPAGESVSDWLIDISSGRLQPEPEVAATKALEQEINKNKKEKTKTKEKEKEDEIELVKPLLSPRDDDAVGAKGVSTGKANDAFEEAKFRRAWLYDKWNEHFGSLCEEGREIYEVPPESKLPATPKKQNFLSQLFNQVSRAFLVSWRNLTSKLIDTTILVLATIVITVSTGLPEMTLDVTPNVAFVDLVQPTEEGLPDTLKQVFKYAATPQQE
jgi:hypothetical protein